MSLLKPNKSRERRMVGLYIERMPFFRPKSEILVIPQWAHGKAGNCLLRS